MLSLLRLRRPAPQRLEDHPTVILVESLLQEGLALGASDLHVAPDGRGGAACVARVDGMLRPTRILTLEELPRVVARLKVLASLSAFRTGEPQDGALTVRSSSGDVQARLATVPVLDGERASVRFLDPAAAPRTLHSLGLRPEALAALRAVVSLPSGAVVVTGPCSSGKSTTLHALAREILASRGTWTHVATVEDPVELRLPGATQVEVNPARGLDFPDALSSLLRHDPQVLLVGETRDPRTARLAIEAAFTGHLLLTSLHVGSPEAVASRLAVLDVPEHLVRGALRVIACQRLLRRRCGACDARRCDACAGTGHRGRLAVAEVVLVEDGAHRWLTPGLREQVEAWRDEGVTTDEEARRVLGTEGP